jgi:glycerol uptake facilitator-like aquaporin
MPPKTWTATYPSASEALLQISTKLRAGPSQWFSEWIAAFGLVLTILLTLRANAMAVATSVGLYITAAYWFTASTSFANPAVTIARAFSNTFAGIRPQDVLPFIVAQLVGAVAAIYVGRWLLDERMVTRARRSPAELSDVHHNPSGGTSRNTLAVLRLSGQEPEISMNDPEVRAWNARTRV